MAQPQKCGWCRFSSGPMLRHSAYPTHTGSPVPMPEGHAQIPRPAGSPAEVARRRFGRYGVLWGILSVSGAFAIFTLHDAGIKWLVAGYAPLQVLFIRSAVILVICTCIGRQRLAVQSIRSPIRNTLLLRSLGLLGAWLCFYTAARSLQLAELTTIYFASPLMVAALAVPILRERVSPARWGSIVVGFVGVLIACRPRCARPRERHRSRSAGGVPLGGVHDPDPAGRTQGIDPGADGHLELRLRDHDGTADGLVLEDARLDAAHLDGLDRHTRRGRAIPVDRGHQARAGPRWSRRWSSRPSSGPSCSAM